MPDGAAHIQDATGLEVRMLLFEVQDNRLTHVIVQTSQAAHGVNIDGPVIGRSGSYIVLLQFGVVAARLTVNVHRRVVGRNG